MLITEQVFLQPVSVYFVKEVTKGSLLNKATAGEIPIEKNFKKADLFLDNRLPALMKLFHPVNSQIL